MPTVNVRLAFWVDDEQNLRNIREQVFIKEQNVPAELEWDEQDPVCTHAIAETETGIVLGVGRLLADGQIGRMAVLKHARSQGVGAAVLQYLMSQANIQGMETVWLHGQTHAVPFYQQHGFVSEEAEFMEAGIPHFMMRCRLVD